MISTLLPKITFGQASPTVTHNGKMMIELKIRVAGFLEKSQHVVVGESYDAYQLKSGYWVLKSDCWKIK